MGRDYNSRNIAFNPTHFNPRAPCGARRRSLIWPNCWPNNFNPRAPCGARPRTTGLSFSSPLFQSTRPVWGATQRAIHRFFAWDYFNPRAPCGARPPGSPFAPSLPDFNPRAPCGARHTLPRMIGNALVISIHAPRVGRDLIDNYTFLAASQFQSTRPVWGATSGGAKVEAHTVISIHAPRVGRDADQLLCRGQVSIFQSTRPVWGATMHHRRNVGGRNYFNPRAPCGARHLMRGDSRP